MGKKDEMEKDYEKAAGKGRKQSDLNPESDMSPIPLGKVTIIVMGFLMFMALILFLLVPGIFGG